MSAGGDDPLVLVGPQLDAIYACMERFVESFGGARGELRRDRALELAEHARALLDAEHIAWTELREAAARGAGRLQPLVSLADVKRAAVLVRLVPLFVRLRRQGAAAATGAPPPETAATPADTLDAGLRALLEAGDELAVLDAFLALVVDRRDALIAYLLQAPADSLQPLATRLWYGAGGPGLAIPGLADLAVLQCAGEAPAVLHALARVPVVGARFAALQQLLAGAAPDTAARLTAAFAEAGAARVEEHELHMTWRCLLLAGTTDEARAAAAAALPTGELWRALAFPGVGVAAVCAVGRRVLAQGQDGECRVFFDVARACLDRALRERAPGWPLVGELLEGFFGLSFFVEKEYFERLERLWRAFRQAAPESDQRLPAFERAMERLAQTRVKLGHPGARLPASVRSLPAPVQRHLARAEGAYVGHFILHPDYRIAGETRPHIGLGNVQALLLYRAINEQLFRELLGAREFFTRSSTVLTAVNHPKCTREFAQEYLQWLVPAELQKLARNPHANRAVAELAKQRLAAAGSGPAARRAPAAPGRIRDAGSRHAS